MNKFVIFASAFFFTLVFTSPGAHAVDVGDYVPNAKSVGKARFEYYFWDVYDVELVAPNGQYSPEKPFALTLTYLRDFEGAEIAKRSVKEIKQQGFDDEGKLDSWHQSMKSIFPDIKEGQSLTGIRNDSGDTRFYHDGKEIGVITDSEFTRQFFDIWLGENTSEPELREKILESQ
mgnify:CR=1 FL=1